MNVDANKGYRKHPLPNCANGKETSLKSKVVGLKTDTEINQQNNKSKKPVKSDSEEKVKAESANTVKSEERILSDFKKGMHLRKRDEEKLKEDSITDTVMDAGCFRDSEEKKAFIMNDLSEIERNLSSTKLSSGDMSDTAESDKAKEIESSNKSGPKSDSSYPTEEYPPLNPSKSKRGFGRSTNWGKNEDLDQKDMNKYPPLGTSARTGEQKPPSSSRGIGRVDYARSAPVSRCPSPPPEREVGPPPDIRTILSAHAVSYDPKFPSTQPPQHQDSSSEPILQPPLLLTTGESYEQQVSTDVLQPIAHRLFQREGRLTDSCLPQQQEPRLDYSCLPQREGPLIDNFVDAKATTTETYPVQPQEGYSSTSSPNLQLQKILRSIDCEETMCESLETTTVYINSAKRDSNGRSESNSFPPGMPIKKQVHSQPPGFNKPPGFQGYFENSSLTIIAPIF